MKTEKSSCFSTANAGITLVNIPPAKCCAIRGAQGCQRRCKCHLHSTGQSLTVKLTMRPRPLSLLLVATAIACVLPALVAHHRSRQAHAVSAKAAPAEAALPGTVAWVWERPEDLHSLSPQTQAAAIYQGTLVLGDRVAWQPRRNPVILPAGIKTIATVRMETMPGFGTHHNDRRILQATVTSLVNVAQKPDIAALQIDFDARRSEHVFYRNVLNELRRQMPAQLPLEITALVSWCSEDDWISTLPVNAAIPMFFRMEPDRARMVRTAMPSAHLPEPLCNTTVGVSTHEPWPTGIAHRRVYVFPDRGWKHDLPLLTALEQSAQ